MITGIYKITSPSGKVYIGQAVNVERRFSEYRVNRASRQPRLCSSFKKYGVEAHTFEVVEECRKEELSIRERFWQEHYNVLVEGLNLQLVEVERASQVHHKDTIKKITDKTRTGREERCSACGKEVYVQKCRSAKYQKFYCSTECRIVGLNKKKEKECLICGDTFMVWPSHESIIKTCGAKECKAAAYSRAVRQRKKVSL